MEAATSRRTPGLQSDLEAIRALAARQAAQMSPQKYLRGLFASGTCCCQSQQILKEAGLALHSNAPFKGVLGLEDPQASRCLSLINMGAEFFVQGRLNPMIDATLRRLGRARRIAAVVRWTPSHRRLCLRD